MKLSVSLPAEDIEFIDEQVRAGLFGSRSAAIDAALRAMRANLHADSYAAAWDEWDASDAQLWESTVADGLTP